jgi:hypothetical protein
MNPYKAAWVAKEGETLARLHAARPPRAKGPCRGLAMHNGRCRMQGGTSMGPRTETGWARSRRSNWKHGRYSAKAKLEVMSVQRFVRACRAQCLDIVESCR